MSEPIATPPSRRPAPAPVEINRHGAGGAAYSWRIAVIAAVVVGAVWLTGQLLVVVVPVAVAALLSRALSPLSARLRRAGWRPGLAAVTVLAGFVVASPRWSGRSASAVAGELGDLGPTLEGGGGRRRAVDRRGRSVRRQPGGRRPLARPGRRVAVVVRRVRPGRTGVRRPRRRGGRRRRAAGVGRHVLLPQGRTAVRRRRRGTLPPRPTRCGAPVRRPGVGRGRRLPPRRGRARRGRGGHDRPGAAAGGRLARRAGDGRDVPRRVRPDRRGDRGGRDRGPGRAGHGRDRRRRWSSRRWRSSCSSWTTTCSHP